MADDREPQETAPEDPSTPTDAAPAQTEPLPDSTQDTVLESTVAGAQTQLSPLSIQAASLVRSIEGLSNIFWISIGGTFLTIFFAGLSQLDVNASNDYIYLGEYQVPRSILPLASLTFALFTFWMTANRLNMLAYVLSTTRLPRDMVHEIFHLNPPILHVFDRANADTLSPFTGVSVLILLWAVFFGNSIALTLATAAQQGASFAEIDAPMLLLFAVLTVFAIGFGVRTIFPPLRTILGILHGVDFRVGLPRSLVAVAVLLGVYATNNTDIFEELEQVNDLLGPSIANAVDGDTLFMLGVEIELFGIDAVERDQICQDSEGNDYPCGRVATQALQSLVQRNDVICNPLFPVSETKVVAICELISDDVAVPRTPADFVNGFRQNSLARILVEQGHALSVGLAKEVLAGEQLQAQTLRVGIWQGSFQPPSVWRISN